RAFFLAVVPAKAGTQYSRTCLPISEHGRLTGDYWVPAFAGTTAASQSMPQYHPPQAGEKRPWPRGNRPLNRARRDVHGQREQCGIEHERQYAVTEDGTADRPAAHGHVGHLRAHADHERKIHEIPVVRLAVLVRKFHAAALAFVLVVIFMRVVQREDGVRERP